MLINEENCLKETGFPITYFLELTGIYGVYPDFDESKNPPTIDFNMEKDGDYVEIEIETELLSEFRRTIYITRKKIKNNVMVASDQAKGTGIALKLLNSQVRFAMAYGYHSIQINAYRELNKNSTAYGGYSFWPQYGFVMSEVEQKKFRYVMKENRRREKSLYELLQSEEGRIFWKENGYKWIGIFDLSENSFSLKILQEKRDSKGLA